MSERHGDDADLLAIDKLRDDHVGALNAGNADAWVAQFAEDGVQMPPNAPANVGKANIGLWSSGLLRNFRVQFGLTVDEVRVLGDWAFERGGYAIELNPAAGGPSMEDRGKYVTIYRKSAKERWQMARDIWNSDIPLPGF
jgi:uncharacterized protein (TIGR02246 family)